MTRLQEFIKKNPVEWEILLKHDPYNLTIKHEDGLVIFNYQLWNSDLGDPMVQECRGIILEEGSWKIVCRGFDKFFNYGEAHAANIDWETTRVQTKVDGSILKCYYYNGQWRVATNGMINAFEVMAVSAHQENNTVATTFGDLFRQCAKNQSLNLGLLDKNNTYIFELTTPYNEQVIKYNKSAIWHIGTRSNITGEEFNIDIGIQKPEEWEFQTLDDVVAVASRFKDEQEGFVAVDGNYNRVKIKSPYYVATSHYFNDTLALSKLIGIFFSGDYEEFLAYYPKYAKIIRTMENFVSERVKIVKKDAEYWGKIIKSGQNVPIKSAFYLQVKDQYSGNYLCKLYDYLTGIRPVLYSPKEYVMRDIHLYGDIKKHLRAVGLIKDETLL